MNDALGDCDETSALLWVSLGVRLTGLCIVIVQAIRTRAFTLLELVMLLINEVVFGVLWDSMRSHCSLVLNQTVHLALLFVQIGSFLIIALSLAKSLAPIVVSALLVVSIAGLGVLQFVVLDTTDDLMESAVGLIYGFTQAVILARIVCVLHNKHG